MDPILECRTPPASPELSRLVTKRRCPFGESPHQSKMPATEATMAVNEHTHTDNGGNVGYSDNAFEVLMNSQRNQGDDVSQPSLKPATVSSLCWVCHQQGEKMPCAFCEHNACEMCVRQCDRCFGVFCTFCSTINYDNHEDRPLCLTCHSEDMRCQQNRGANAGAMQQPGAWQQGHTVGFRPLTA